MRQGRASAVTDLGDGTVLRTGGRPAREAELMELARMHAYPVPRVVEVLADGLRLERIDGPTMGDRLRRHPWELGRAAAVLADLHARLHAIALDGGALLHFDLHPDNVILSTRGPVVIDWTNAHPGPPETDLAMTWLILSTSGGVPGRLLAMLFRRWVGSDALRIGLGEARSFRLADPNVTDAERTRVRRASP